MHFTGRAVTAAIAIAAIGAGQMLPAQAQAAREDHPWTITAASDDPMPKPLPVHTNTRYAHRVLSAALKENGSSTTTDAAMDSSQQVAIVQDKLDGPGGGVYSLALGIAKGRTEWPSGAVFNPTLTITNTGSGDLIYSEGGLGAVWQIETPEGRVVYDSARGRIIPHIRLRHRLTPGQTQVFTAPVSLKDNGGHPLPPGHYVLRGHPGVGLGGSVDTKITIDPPA